jgi:hypothetical protein
LLAAMGNFKKMFGCHEELTIVGCHGEFKKCLAALKKLFGCHGEFKICLAAMGNKKNVWLPWGILKKMFGCPKKIVWLPWEFLKKCLATMEN